MSTKVTVIVETGKSPIVGGLRDGRNGSRETFVVEWEGNPEPRLVAAHVEHRVAELGAEVVAKVAAVYGDPRVGTPFTVPRELRTFPLGDYLRQLTEIRKGAFGAGFNFNIHDPEIGRKVQAGLTEMRARLEEAGRMFVENVERAQKRPVAAADGKAGAADDKPL